MPGTGISSPVLSSGDKVLLISFLLDTVIIIKLHPYCLLSPFPHSSSCLEGNLENPSGIKVVLTLKHTQEKYS
jgi:hypothetical protein